MANTLSPLCLRSHSPRKSSTRTFDRFMALTNSAVCPGHTSIAAPLGQTRHLSLDSCTISASGPNARTTTDRLRGLENQLRLRSSSAVNVHSVVLLSSTLEVTTKKMAPQAASSSADLPEPWSDQNGPACGTDQKISIQPVSAAAMPTRTRKLPAVRAFTLIGWSDAPPESLTSPSLLPTACRGMNEVSTG